MKTVALITGGFTGESVVSLKSAAFVASKLNPGKYTVYTIVISPEQWYYEDESGRHNIDKNDFRQLKS